MVRHGNANGKAFAPVFTNCPMMNRHIPVELTVSVLAVPRKSARIRPLERLDAQNRPIIVVMFHIVGHEHMPVIHDERFIVIALRPLFVVPRENEKTVVVDQCSSIGRIKSRCQRVRRFGKRKAQSNYKENAKARITDNAFQPRKEFNFPKLHKHLRSTTQQPL